jgi:NAD(P)-dependent dehydrogenase (short-subunit alcohol dehydrogenase family)
MTAPREATDLTGKVAIVTGSTRGWGKGVADQLAALGARVIVNGRSQETVTAAVQSIVSAGGQAAGVAADMTTWNGATKALDASLDNFGSLDILVNSVGEKRMGGLLEISFDDWQYALGSELNAVFCMTKVAATHMVAQGTGGRIVHVAGGSGIFGSPGDSAHAASKAAVINATMSWAQELAPFGITVNAVRGGVRTDYVNGVVSRLESTAPGSGSKMRALGFYEPQEAAPLVGWLASADASAVTGAFVGIDGPRLSVWQPRGPVEYLFRWPSWTPDEVGKALLPRLGGQERWPQATDLLFPGEVG